MSRDLVFGGEGDKCGARLGFVKCSKVAPAPCRVLFSNGVSRPCLSSTPRLAVQHAITRFLFSGEAVSVIGYNVGALLTVGSDCVGRMELRRLVRGVWGHVAERRRRVVSKGGRGWTRRVCILVLCGALLLLVCMCLSHLDLFRTGGRAESNGVLRDSFTIAPCAKQCHELCISSAVLHGYGCEASTIQSLRVRFGSPQYFSF